METKLKNYELINLPQAINGMMQNKLPVKTGWNLTKNTKSIEKAIEFFAKAEQDLVEQYAIKDDENKVKYKDNGQPEIYPKHQETFMSEHNELLNCDSEISVLLISLSDLIFTKDKDGNAIEREIEPSILHTLMFMIEDDLN